MAILKMKRLRLMVLRSEKDELLRELASRGCVELSEIGEELQADEAGGLVSRESSALTVLKSQQAELGRAITLLDKYAPAKSFCRPSPSWRTRSSWTRTASPRR